MNILKNYFFGTYGNRKTEKQKNFMYIFSKKTTLTGKVCIKLWLEKAKLGDWK